MLLPYTLHPGVTNSLTFLLFKVCLGNLFLWKQEVDFPLLFNVHIFMIRNWKQPAKTIMRRQALGQVPFQKVTPENTRENTLKLPPLGLPSPT